LFIKSCDAKDVSIAMDAVDDYPYLIACRNNLIFLFQEDIQKTHPFVG